MTVLIGANGSVLRQEIDGAIQMKSFLQGTPEIFIGLNENMSIGKSAAGVDYSKPKFGPNPFSAPPCSHFPTGKKVISNHHGQDDPVGCVGFANPKN